MGMYSSNNYINSMLNDRIAACLKGFLIVFLKIIENCILAVSCQPFVFNNS